ncbi:hypothetical protein D9V84_04365 [Bacteroidetes/Chlorobi group bacterium Naka2016]|jgi:hypothetical protein|nr:MAG: hypothetical protein D9V84_04365 [Bacteroidetes/Chlorobi group bacterium Naka2016]
MKKVFFVFVFLFAIASIKSAPMGVGFSLGLATPNDQINNVYNSNKINLNNNLWNVAKESAKIGYYLSLNLNLPLSENFNFKGGIALNRFPQSEIKLIFPGEPADTVILKSMQNFVPISAGFDLFLFRSVVSPYISGNLSYFYLVNSIDIVKMNQELPISNSKIESRIGAGIGAGVDFDLEIISLNLEAKYWFVNLIGSGDNEPKKNYLTVGIGIVFGGR